MRIIETAARIITQDPKSSVGEQVNFSMHAENGTQLSFNLLYRYNTLKAVKEVRSKSLEIFYVPN
ncbi:hypothetical protein KIN20_027317 [Parelaphostrongylus tenuis]|uniref:Uncharacterized protein n=1 Tax=Parelaphostrongylus tenuis TaxID=148309 RepID=A0AAD5WE12_PARTN|nr:hypothetical protein KIN20_027317 [Parelaphostrongylus tenuis]